MPLEIHFQLTLPKDGVFRNKKWKDEVMRAMKYPATTELKDLFEKTVYGWSEENKPKFKSSAIWIGDEAHLTMWPDGPGAKIWELVSEGASPHPIYPSKQGGLLKFRPGYRAATTPGSLISRRAYRSGPYVTAKSVQHPGFEGREFPDLISREFERTYINHMQDAFNTAARG